MADVPEPKEDVHVTLPGASDDGEDGDADDDEGSFTLRNINFSVKAGELLCVIGRVGSGKSSLVSVHGFSWKAVHLLHASNLTRFMHHMAAASLTMACCIGHAHE